MSINLIHPARGGTDPRSLYLRALSVAEHLISDSPAIPASLDIRAYGEWEFGRYGLSVHLRKPADVAAFARWIGAHVTTELRSDGMYGTTALGEFRGTPFHAWALHSDGEWLARQTKRAGELAAQAHDMYDLDADSTVVVPGCAPVGYVQSAAPCGSVRDVLPCVLDENHPAPMHRDANGYEWPTAGAAVVA
ncbi:hypothetical protein FCH28_09560 [Streptomyces piniterrae]|uniref:Uncharacterized protein n=1 Tax=Streptomyces piniterrae TaxID=2571125 RepID=A0A4V5ML27_9ACTN|nr:hypothetical protein [Streptomyces piniterrae]TJZ55578.1 hypothetical protein FCH28_09560 [Streptomyces piniterrae]